MKKCFEEMQAHRTPKLEDSSTLSGRFFRVFDNCQICGLVRSGWKIVSVREDTNRGGASAWTCMRHSCFRAAKTRMPSPPWFVSSRTSVEVVPSAPVPAVRRLNEECSVVATSASSPPGETVKYSGRRPATIVASRCRCANTWHQQRRLRWWVVFQFVETRTEAGE